MSAADKLLDRLDGVKRTGDGRWIAKCPAHEDRSPSLSIRELPDGRILLHDFGGCETGDVLAALGLQFSDLFDSPLRRYLPPIRGGFSARELLELISHEATVVEILMSDAQQRALTEAEKTRLLQAAERIGKAREMAYG